MPCDVFDPLLIAVGIFALTGVVVLLSSGRSQVENRTARRFVGVLSLAVALGLGLYVASRPIGCQVALDDRLPALSAPGASSGWDARLGAS